MATSAYGQQTRPVSDVAGFAAAYAAAGPQDLILMEPGEYEFLAPDRFRIDKSVRVAARHPGFTLVRSDLGATVTGIQEGEFVSIDGVVFGPANTATTTGPALVVSACQGEVLLHESYAYTNAVDFAPSQPVGFPGLLVAGASVHASGCEFDGSQGLGGSGTYAPGSAVVAIDSQLYFDDCRLAGARGSGAVFLSASPAWGGAPALVMEGGSLFATRTDFFGGIGGDGVELAPGSCLDPAPGGDAITCPVAVATPMSLLGCWLLPGYGGVEANGCGDGQAPFGLQLSGPGVVPSVVESTPFAIGLDAPGAVQGGGFAWLEIQGLELHSTKFLALSFGVQSTVLPGLQGYPVLLAPPISLLPMPSYGGQVFALPDLGASGLHLGVVLQPLELPSSGLPILHPARFLSVY